MQNAISINRFGARKNIRTTCVFATLAFVLTWVIVPVGTAAAQQDLLEMVASAEDSFQSIGDAELFSAKREVRTALQAVERRVAPNRRYAVGWMAYLKRNELLQNLSRDDMSDTALYEDIHIRLTHDATGLEEPCFQGLRRALLQLIEVTRAAEHPDLEQAFKQHLSEVEKALPRNGKTLSSDGARELSKQLTLLAQLRQVPDLVERIRQRHLHSNLRVVLPESLVKTLFNRDVDEPFDYRRNIGGASVSGDGRLKASVRSSLEVNDTAGAIRLEGNGTSDSETVAYENSVWLYTDNSLTFSTESTLLFEPEGLSLEPFQSTGSLSNPITGYSSNYGGRAAPTARSTAYARHRARRFQAQQTALGDVSRGFTERMGDTVSALNEYYQQRVRLPLLRCNRFPEEVAFRSGPGGLEIQAAVASSRELAGPPKLPEVSDDDKLQMVCHESLFNNILSAKLGGRTRSLPTVLNSLMMTEAPTEPESHALDVTFTESEPLRVRFASSKMSIELSGAKYSYEYQGEEVESADEIGISFSYQVKSNGGKWQLVLHENPRVDLPAAGLRGVARRRVLANILARDLPKHIDIDRFTLAFSDQLALPLDSESVRIEDGWLVMRMRVAAD